MGHVAGIDLNPNSMDLFITMISICYKENRAEQRDPFYEAKPDPIFSVSMVCTLYPTWFFSRHISAVTLYQPDRCPDVVVELCDQTGSDPFDKVLFARERNDVAVCRGSGTDGLLEERQVQRARGLDGPSYVSAPTKVPPDTVQGPLVDGGTAHFLVNLRVQDISANR